MKWQGKMEPQHQQNTIQRLIKRLRRNNPVRRIAERLLRGDWQVGFPDQSFQTLLNSLTNQKDYLWKERAVAAWALRQAALDPQQKQVAANVLHKIVMTVRESEDSGRFKRTYLPRALLFTALLTPPLIVPMFLQSRNPPVYSDLDIFALIVCIPLSICFAFLPALLMATPMALLSVDSGYNRVRAEAVRTLSALGLAQSAASLSVAACVPYTAGARQVRQAAKTALPAVLSQLTPEDFGQQDSEMIPYLCHLLSRSEEPLVLAILEALGKVGDGRAVLPVQRLAVKGRTERIRAAAASILPVLEQRQKQENDPQVLLRAASQDAAASNVLLRPASSTPATEPQQLLRASYAEENREP